MFFEKLFRKKEGQTIERVEAPSAGPLFQFSDGIF